MLSSLEAHATVLLAQDLKFLDSEAALGVQLLYSASANCAATSFWVPCRQHLRLAAWYAFRFPARVIPFVLGEATLVRLSVTFARVEVPILRAGVAVEPIKRL